MEKRIDEDTEKLLEASVKGDGERIKKLSNQFTKQKVRSIFFSTTLLLSPKSLTQNPENSRKGSVSFQKLRSQGADRAK